MEDRLIFPTSIEQVGTGELVHDTFPQCKWTNVLDEPQAYYISDIKLDIAPVVFFEWAYQTPAGMGPILFYCLNLSIQFLVEPTDWMIDIVNRHRVSPWQLSDGH
jgi:hypothetical protein